MTSAYSADVPSIKVENLQDAAVGRDARIKSETDGIPASPGQQIEDDIYEDAGDLDFSGADQGFYLTKFPKFLWDNLSKLDAKQEIQVGTIRVEGDMDDIKRMSLFLTPQAAAIHQLPREYNMPVIEQHSFNTFIFSEKDLPGHRKYTAGRAPPRSHDRNKVEKPKGSGKPFTRFIPKQTSLSGHIQSEFNCLPVENRELQQYSMRENNRREAQKPKIKQWLGGDVVIDGEPTNYFDGLISNSQVTTKKKKEKAARIAQNDLMDLIFDCFKDFKYWTSASLRARLNQPAAFLKETLDKVAILIKAGPMSGKYQLKPEFTNTGSGAYDNVKAEAAPDMTEDDDDDEEMEDVI